MKSINSNNIATGTIILRALPTMIFSSTRCGLEIFFFTVSWNAVLFLLNNKFPAYVRPKFWQLFSKCAILSQGARWFFLKMAEMDSSDNFGLEKLFISSTPIFETEKMFRDIRDMNITFVLTYIDLRKNTPFSVAISKCLKLCLRVVSSNTLMDIT